MLPMALDLSHRGPAAWPICGVQPAIAGWMINRSARRQVPPAMTPVPLASERAEAAPGRSSAAGAGSVWLLACEHRSNFSGRARLASGLRTAVVGVKLNFVGPDETLQPKARPLVVKALARSINTCTVEFKMMTRPDAPGPIDRGVLFGAGHGGDRKLAVRGFRSAATARRSRRCSRTQGRDPELRNPGGEQIRLLSAKGLRQAHPSA